MPLTDENYYVYKHTNRLNGKIYIGITRQNPERRWQKGYGYKGTYFWNAVCKYGWDTFNHEILFSGLSKENACEIEKRLIAIYHSNQREFGYNICEGGQTGDNLAPCYGKANVNASSVIRIDPSTGERVFFETVAEAAKGLKINHRGISKACRGESKTYKGYVWEYASGKFAKPQKPQRGKYPHTAQQKRVKLCEPDGAEIEYESIKAAGEATGIRPNTISRYLSGVRKDASGRRWLYCL